MKQFLRSKLSVMTILAMTSLSLTACNNDDDSNTTIVKPQTPSEAPNPNEPEPDNPTESVKNVVSGKLVSYDGETPIANALVYITSQDGVTASTMSRSYRLDAQANKSVSPTVETTCGVAPLGSLASTCTDVDGSYSLDIQTDTKKLLINFKKGAFTTEQKFTQENGLNKLDTIALKDVPNMVVIEGSYDSIELILARLGLASTDAETGKITDSEFELWDATDKLFVDNNNDGKADIYYYDIVFFNCGQNNLDWLMDDSKRQTLKDYVQSGGRIYVSDQAYDIVEQTFPEYIDFYGSDNTPTNQPEDMSAANTGKDDITINSTLEPILKSWLKGVTCINGSCLESDSTAKISGFRGGWARINSVNSNKNVDVYASGQDSNGTMRPLTVAFNYGDGRVTYTSYHNEDNVIVNEYCNGEFISGNLTNDEYYECLDENPVDLSKVALDPQQRILQYLVFEL